VRRDDAIQVQATTILVENATELTNNFMVVALHTLAFLDRGDTRATTFDCVATGDSTGSGDE